MELIDTIRKTALDLVAPHYCLVCRRRSDRRLGLCKNCGTNLPAVNAPCPRCALPDTGGHVCGRCQARPPSFDGTLAAFAYAEPVDRLVWRLKFAADLPAAHLLGSLLAERVAAAGLPRPGVIVPVPLYRGRLVRRGFNQSVELGRVLARRLGVPLDPALAVRTRNTPSQQSLGAGERRRNVRGCFALARPPRLARVALLDDVMTSGATLDALAAAFKAAGDVEVQCWVCARA